MPWRELRGTAAVIVPKENVQRSSPRWGRGRREGREMRRRRRNSEESHIQVGWDDQQPLLL